MESYLFTYADYILEHYRYILFILGGGMFVAGAIGFTPLFTKEDVSTSEHFMAFLRKLNLSLLSASYAGLLYLSYIGGLYHFDWSYLPSVSFHILALIIYVLGKAIAILYHRVVIPRLSSIKEYFRVAVTGENLSDIRAEHENKIESLDFKPEDYIKEGHYFLGLDEKGKPLYATDEEWMMNHKCAVGPTQVGKGVDIGVQIHQAIAKDICTIYIDPKPDKFVRSIMRDACEKHDRTLREIDLLGKWDMEKYAVMANGHLRDKKVRLLRMFNLNNTGTDADHYKTKERTELDRMLDIEDNSFNVLQSLIRQEVESTDKPIMAGSNAYAKELSQIGSIDQDGVNIGKAIANNEVIYVRCSTTDAPVISLAVALIEDVVQTIIDSAPENGGARKKHVFLIVDELRFVLNQYIADALATMKSANAHMYIAFQSFEDVKNIKEMGIDKESLQESIFTNCTHKLIYRTDNGAQAEWAAKQMGTVQKKTIDRQEVELNKWGGESMTGKRMLTSTDEAAITENKFMMLEERVGVLKRPAALPVIIRTCWIETDLEKNMPNPRKITKSKKSIKAENAQIKELKTAKKSINDEAQGLSKVREEHSKKNLDMFR